jgi:tetratricopeptide (TPR) repeat protein
VSGLTARPGVIIGVAVALLLVALIGGQAIASASAPPGGVASTGRVIGQTSFAYLGGLRTFAAAVLWNRLEPLFDGYYSDRNVDEIVMFLTTMRLVQILDPQFEQAYYNASFIVARQGRMNDALDIAREGIKNNPGAGLMLANYAQLLLIQDKKANLPELLKLAEKGIQPEIRWANADDRFEGYGIFRAVFDLAGNQPMVDALQKAQDALKQQGAGQTQGQEGLPTGGGN